MTEAKAPAAGTNPQQPLQFPADRRQRLEQFVPGDNSELLATLTGLCTQLNEQLAADAASSPASVPGLWLVGPTAVGKTHLLLSCCSLVRTPAGATYLDCVDLVQQAASSGHPPGTMLHGHAERSLVALHNVDALLGQQEWEQALFQIYNDARVTGCVMLVVSRSRPVDLLISLADLRSRLGALALYRVLPLPDIALRQLLQRLATARGLEFAPAALDYVLRRWRRDAASLTALMDALDSASWLNKRGLTLPFVREELSRLQELERARG